MVLHLTPLLSSPSFRTQELAIASPECERSGDAMTQYTQLLMLLADQYRGVFRALKIRHPLLCHDQAGLESFLRTVRTLADAGVGALQLNLIVGWQELTREVQDMIEPSKWTVLRHFRITSRRASPGQPVTRCSNIMLSGTTPIISSRHRIGVERFV
ncbi:hypothetical protein EV363DRAFT_1331819 [Boletus edulis]|nr:hypothetical protein EV363DRAFT_1331819 [Boletus edulis]